MPNIGRLCALIVTAGILILPAHRLWAAGSPSTVSQTVPRCGNTQLSLQATQSQGAAGHIAILFRIHKTWGNGCSLQGYPGAELLDRQFHTLPTHVSRGHGYIVSGSPSQLQVTLDSSHDAYFTLEYSDVQTGNGACPRVPYLMVTPPNDRLPIVTYTHGGRSQAYVTPCGGNLVVSPVRASAAFR